MRLAQCRQLGGYSAAVAVNASASQERTMNWLVGSAHVDSVIATCSEGNLNVTRSLWLFVCAEYFPPCMNGNASPWQPCEAFCLGR
jgi:hypothetical protein